MWHATIVSSICFLNCTCDTTSNWVHLIKTEMIFFAIGQSQPGISYLHKKKLLLSARYFASTLKSKLWQRPGHQNLAVTDDDDGAFAFIFVFVFKFCKCKYKH